MSEKIEVVYIGPKEQKRLTVLGRKYIFPRLKPVAVEADAAYHLLDIPAVFSTPEDANSVVEKAEADQAAKQKAQLAEEKAKQAEVKEQSFVVMLDGEQKDISKYTMAKLKTAIEVEELDIETDRKTAGDVRVEIRDALHAKHGNPEV